MKKNVITRDYLGNISISKDVISSLETNGTYLPDVSRVVFNLKTDKRIRVKDETTGEEKTETVKLDNPILVTKIWWADGTSTTVKNSEHDKVETEEVELEDGRKVTVATECSKTFGIMAAVTKRTCGVPDKNGEMINTNLGKILSDIVKSAYDQNVETEKTRIKNAKRKAAAEVRAQKAKEPKAKKYSIAEILNLIGPILENAAKNPDALKNALNALKGA
jgi:transcriptional regulator NrdR family protein